MPDDDDVVVLSDSPDPADAAAQLDDDAGAPGADDAAAAGKDGDGAGEPLDMLQAINAQIAADGKKAELPAKAADAATDAKAKAEADAKAAAAAGAPDAEAKAKAEAAAKKKADEDAAAAIKGKKADDYQLTPEEKKALGQKAQQRFHDLHRLAKSHEAELERLGSENTALSKARDEIMGVLEENKCEAADLVPFLEFNRAVKEGKLEDALAMVEDVRRDILTRLGREAPGVDLLDQFPDLKKRVEEETLERADALALANARRREQAGTEQTREAAHRRAEQDRAVNAQESALAGIAEWQKKLAATDIDYKAKEGKILAQRGDKPSLLREIISTYPPHLWLKTLQAVYGSIEVVKQTTVPANTGLRPSGAKGGGKQASSMGDAIAQGLGYNDMQLPT